MCARATSRHSNKIRPKRGRTSRLWWWLCTSCQEKETSIDKYALRVRIRTDNFCVMFFSTSHCRQDGKTVHGPCSPLETFGEGRSRFWGSREVGGNTRVTHKCPNSSRSGWWSRRRDWWRTTTTRHGGEKWWNAVMGAPNVIWEKKGSTTKADKKRFEVEVELKIENESVGMCGYMHAHFWLSGFPFMTGLFHTGVPWPVFVHGVSL